MTGEKLQKTIHWSPYISSFISELSRRVMDWTMITPNGEPRMECRDFDGEPKDVRMLITGHEPVLLPRQELDGSTRLSTFNMVTFWYWSYGEPERPVRFARPDSFSGGLGASGGLNRIIVAVDDLIVPDHVNRIPCLLKLAGGEQNPLDNWIVFLTIGALIGEFFSACYMAGSSWKPTRGRPSRCDRAGHRLLSAAPLRLQGGYG